MVSIISNSSMSLKRKHDELFELCDVWAHNVESWNSIRKWCCSKDYKAAVIYRDEQNRRTSLCTLLMKHRPPLDVVESMVRLAPETLRMKDKYGWLPIHYACASKASLDFVRVLVTPYPESVRVRVSRKGGWLPIHYAFNNGVPLEVLNLLTEAYPESLELRGSSNEATSDIFREWASRCRKNKEYEFLLQKAAAGGFSVTLVKLLLEEFPESCLTRDENGMIPLHHACENTACQIDVIMALIDAAPESCTTIDNQGRTPSQLFQQVVSCKDDKGMFLLHHVAAHYKGLSVFSLNWLISSFPESISTPDTHRMLPFHHACLNEASPPDILMLLIKLCPESIVYS